MSSQSRDAPYLDYDHGITAIDTGFSGRSWGGVVYLIRQSGRAALIDTGTSLSVPRVLSAIKAKDVGSSDVDTIIVTHVHLDHAGGTGALSTEFPNARVLVHPHGVEHLSDPEVLAASVAKVFGQEKFDKAFGFPKPVAKDRIVETPDGFALDFCGRTFCFVETPGHVGHHVCVHDPLSGTIFTGDAFGYCFPQASRDDRAFVVPATPPPDFDPDAMKRSIDRLVSMQPTAMCLGHGGRLTGVAAIAADLHALIDKFLEFGRKLPGSSMSSAFRIQRLGEIVSRSWQDKGCKLLGLQIKPLLAWDMAVSCQGLEWWAKHGAPAR